MNYFSLWSVEFDSEPLSLLPEARSKVLESIFFPAIATSHHGGHLAHGRMVCPTIIVAVGPMMFFSLLTMSSDRIVKIGFMDKSQVVQTVQLFDQLSMVL